MHCICCVKIATVISNIDFRIKTVKNDFQIKSSDKKNSLAVLSELFEPQAQNVVDLEVMETILTQQTRRKGYSYGCCYLRRIPALDAVEVKELYTFIVDWM